jgi:hypothetical protein
MRSSRLLVALIIALSIIVSACGDKHLATPQGFCADIFGDGQNGRTAGFTKTVWPEQVINDYNSSEQVANFLPCQPRNYKATLHKGEGGDRSTPTKASTKDGTEVLAAWTVYFTPNQGNVAQKQFAELCGKYKCWFTQEDAQNAKFANPQWMGMLHENVGTSGNDAVAAAIEGSAKDELKGYGEESWKNLTVDLKQKIADDASKVFAKMASKRTGYDQDLFCGSGSTSFWKDPKHPGAEGNTYTCSQVRFVIDDIVNADPAQQKAAQQQQAATRDKTSNQSRQDAADKLYGSNQGGYWLGVQDTIERCAQVRQNCSINLGNPPGQR